MVGELTHSSDGEDQGEQQTGYEQNCFYDCDLLNILIGLLFIDIMGMGGNQDQLECCTYCKLLRT